MRYTHGLTNSRAYTTWRAMRQRCNNPNDSAYRNYGGRGITVDPRWNVFENFFADMGHPPEKNWIERVDNSKGYGPNNCKWASAKEQLNNRRNNHVIEAFGRKQTLTQWSQEYKIPVTTLKNRIMRAGMMPEQALLMEKQTGYYFSPLKYNDGSIPQQSRWKNP